MNLAFSNELWVLGAKHFFLGKFRPCLSCAILLLLSDERIPSSTLHRKFQCKTLHLIDGPESFLKGAEARVAILDFEAENIEFIESLVICCMGKVYIILGLG